MNTKNLVLSTLGHTWIFDLDGTVVKHNGYKIDGEDTFLQGAKEFLTSIPAGDMIIFLTSRTEEFRDMTEKFLAKNNIRYDAIIFNAPLGERIILNDNKPQGLVTALAIPRQRDNWENLTIEEDPSL